MWSDPRVVYAVAVSAVVLLVATIWLFRRTKREGRAAGTICLILSVLLHGVLVWLVPYKPQQHGTAQSSDGDTVGLDSIELSTFDPDLQFDDSSAKSNATPFMPLPVDQLTDLVDPAPASATPETPQPSSDPADQEPPDLSSIAELEPQQLDESLESIADDALAALDAALQAQLDDLAASAPAVDEGEMSAPEQPLADVADLTTAFQEPPPAEPGPLPEAMAMTASVRQHETFDAVPQPAAPPARPPAAPSNVAGQRSSDFANRTGRAKDVAIEQTGGDVQTEAAVRAALRFLAETQNPDGSWNPQTSGAGEERRPLGEQRFGAGKKCTTALTGLSLLAMMGAGNTHQSGPYAENVYRGLAYLIQHQHPNGSLEGNATLYAASYCHSMAALAVCEDAVMTGDASAIECARRAIAHTTRMQHPITGGWRYTRGDPGDLSQLGWHAMMLHSGRRAGIEINQDVFSGIQRFLRSVQVGSGGLACYRPGENISRTMTAEALAIRLLLGEAVASHEIAEAERYLLQQRPGMGQDNYYYWYYATLALHQIQDQAWTTWNDSLKQRVLSTQRPDGSWPNTSLWGGYGGPIYTTAMATLCLETYYRHTLRQ
ncbi:hypothetical protein CGZ80_19930 [Rhodopirellula sp. MGV]|nr:hypothetical protein CGZ80_19930 [Rhodopirellula sp. MGV]PNY35987.1 squalene--hopene cyclase [Rhodopirellula baltica]